MPQIDQQEVIKALYQAAQNGESLPTLLVRYNLHTSGDLSRLYLNKTYQGITPLWIATQKGHLDTVSYLLQIGASRTSCVLSYEAWQIIIEAENNVTKKQRLSALLVNKQQAGETARAIHITPLEIAYAMQDQRIIEQFHSIANFPLLRSFETLAEHLHYAAPKEPFCHGFAFKWLVASMLQKETVFNQRLHQIEHHEAHTLCEQIKEARSLTKAHERLTPTQIALLEIPPFYDSVLISQNPFNYQAFFSEPLSQDNLVALSAYTNSIEVDAMGGVSLIHSSAFIYTELELQTYLHQIGELIQSVAPLPGPVGLLLTSHDHTIALSIQGAFWKFMDVNYYPSTLHELNDTANLAKQIIQSFSSTTSHTKEYFAFNTTVLFIGYPELHTKLREAFLLLQNQETYAITPVIAARFGNTNIAYLAAMHGHNDTLVKLSEQRANLDLATNNKTPLQIATQNGHWATLALLVTGGADPLATQSDTGFTLMHIAAKYGHANTIQILKEVYDLNPDTLSHTGMTAACLAAQQGHTDVLFELKHIGANFELSNRHHKRPVCFAAARGDVFMIEKLGQWGINLDIAEPEKPTPMSEAALHNQVGVLQKLLQLGVSPYATLHNGSTAAHLAAQEGHETIIELLCRENAALLDRPRKDGYTPAHVAAEHGHANIIRTLAKVANLNLLSNTRDTPLSLALKNKDTNVVAALHASQANFYIPIPLFLELEIHISPLFYTILVQDIDTLTYLLKNQLSTVTQENFSYAELRSLLCRDDFDELIRLNGFNTSNSPDERIFISPHEFAYLHERKHYPTKIGPMEHLLNTYIPHEESSFSVQGRAEVQKREKQHACAELLNILTPPTYSQYQRLFYKKQIAQKNHVFKVLRQALTNNTTESPALTPDDIMMLHHGDVGNKLRHFIKSGLAHVLVAPSDVSNINDLLAIMLHRSNGMNMTPA